MFICRLSGALIGPSDMTDVIGRDGFRAFGGRCFGATRIAMAGERFLNSFLKLRRAGGLPYDPCDIEIRKDLADRLFHAHCEHLPLGTAETGRLLLDIIQDTFPTERLSRAYFDNLDKLLAHKPVRRSPGRVLIGLGSGRCGSTSLAKLVSTIEGSCCTHENPPLLSWTPDAEEIDFHLKRIERLATRFSLVADVAHWWLNALAALMTHLPDALVIAITRDAEDCARSFFKIKGTGIGSCNHWVPYGNGIWSAERWDPTYPTYAVPKHAWDDPNGAKFELITRYVREYNASARALARSCASNLLMLKTDDLSDPAMQRKLFDFVGASGAINAVRLNVGTTKDGRRFRDRHLI
jgi:hypothetical protein